MCENLYSETFRRLTVVGYVSLKQSFETLFMLLAVFQGRKRKLFWFNFDFYSFFLQIWMIPLIFGRLPPVKAKLHILRQPLKLW